MQSHYHFKPLEAIFLSMNHIDKGRKTRSPVGVGVSAIEEVLLKELI